MHDCKSATLLEIYVITMSSFCDNCRENVQFYERDGLFYCNQCDIQSETMQVMEHSQMDSQPSQSFNAAFSRVRAVKVASATKHKAEARKRLAAAGSSKDDDKSWWLAEVFQVILKAQVEALIGMGVTPKLREVVKRLWFMYVQKSGWAGGKDAQTPSKKRKKTGDGTSKEEGQESKQKGKKEASSDRTAKDGGAWNKDNTNLPRDGAFLRYDSGRSEEFRLHHLLCIIYVAFRFLKEPILFSDLLRWVLEGHLPYYATSDLLPKHLEIKLSKQGSHLFLVARPNNLHISRLKGPITHVLQVLDIPASLLPINLQLVVSRFITALNLPALFHQITHHLLRVHPTELMTNPRYKRDKKSQPITEEAPSLAYVIVAIKFLLGLDGQTEVTLSKVGRIVRSKMPSGSEIDPFIWEEWVAAQSLKARLYHLDLDLMKPGDVRQMRDCRKFVNHHTRTYLLDAKRESFHRRGIFQDKNVRIQLQQPFRKLRSRYPDDAEDNDGEGGIQKSRPTSFPYVAIPEVKEKDSDGSVGGTMIQGSSGSSNKKDVSASRHAGTEGVSWVSKKELCSVDFSRHSVEYLVNLKKFCKKHGFELGSLQSEDDGCGGECVDDPEGGQVEEGPQAVSGKVKKNNTGKCGGSQMDKARNNCNGREARPDAGGDAATENKSVGKGSKKASSKKRSSKKESVKLSQPELDVLPYEEWKRRILSKVSDSSADNSSCCSVTSDLEVALPSGPSSNPITSSAQPDKLQKRTSARSSSSGGLQRVPYIRYNPTSFRQALAIMERDGEVTGGVFRPFPESYQWLLEHCAALFGLDWIDIHHTVLALEKKIFDLKL